MKAQIHQSSCGLNSELSVKCGTSSLFLAFGFSSLSEELSSPVSFPRIQSACVCAEAAAVGATALVELRAAVSMGRHESVSSKVFAVVQRAGCG